jgi:YHS domain-containing protein
MMNYRLTIPVLLISLLAASYVFAGETKAGHSCGMAQATTAAAPATDTKGADPYPLDHCLVSGEKLGGMGEPVVKVYDGREIKFCCNGCVSKFEKEKADYMQKLDDAIVAKEKPNYPLETCVVTGEKLNGGEMKPADFVYHNRLVRFCCNGCISKFEKDPAKYLKMIDDAAAKKTTKQ